MESHLSGVRDFYFTAIERSLGRRFTLECDGTSWLDFFKQTLNVEVEALVGGFIEWHRMMDECLRNFGEKGWLSRHVDGIAFALRTVQITRLDYIYISGVSQATASSDLAAIIGAGILLAEGKTRTRIYGPNPKYFSAKQQVLAEQLPLIH